MSWRAAATAALAALTAACASVSAPRQPDAASLYADFLVGRVANAREDYGAASDRYYAALSRSPGDEALIAGALRASLTAGDEARARRVAAMAEAEAAPALARLVRAAEAIRAADWRRAERELESTEGDAVQDMLARTLMVWVRVGQRRIDEAVGQLAPLTTLRPYGGLFSYQQAMAFDIAGRRDQARVAYTTAANGGMFLPPAAERHADALVRWGAREEALEMLARLNAGRNNAALQAFAQRIEAGGRVNTLTPARAAAIGLYGFGAILLQQEHNVSAGLIAESLALMIDPGLDDARLLFAEGHARNERYAIARHALASVRAESPYAQTARIMEARLLLEEGRPEQALALANANAAAGDARAMRALADMYASLDRLDEAEPIYSALLAADEANWMLHFARGAVRERLGRWDEAEGDLRRALELSPDQPEVLNYLGYTWVDRGENLEEGLAMIRRAVELRPNSAAIIDSLGWAYFRLGDYQQAQLFLERAVELEPGSATLNDHLGDVYWRLGRRTEARFQWRRALSQEPEDAAAIERKLQDGLPDRAQP